MRNKQKVYYTNIVCSEIVSFILFSNFNTHSINVPSNVPKPDYYFLHFPYLFQRTHSTMFRGILIHSCQVGHFLKNCYLFEKKSPKENLGPLK